MNTLRSATGLECPYRSVVQTLETNRHIARRDDKEQLAQSYAAEQKVGDQSHGG